jgi:hypothetical protein
MTTNIAHGRKKRDRSGENFRKRWRTLIRVGWKVSHVYTADVYIQLRRKGQVFEFKSTDNAWPLSSEDIVIFLLAVDLLLLITTDENFSAPNTSNCR